MDTLQEYLQMIENLRRYPKAPYKPCLLLAIIQLIEQGDILENRIRLSNHLKDAFARYVAQIPGWDPKNIRNPFYHLKNDGFWHLIPNVDRTRQLSSLTEAAGAPHLVSFMNLLIMGVLTNLFFFFSHNLINGQSSDRLSLESIF